MSHIPAAAMPHAQAHHDGPADPVPPSVPVGPRRDQPPFPFAAAIVGGALALGGAATAAWLLRRERKPAKPAKRGRGKAAAAKTPRAKRVSRGARSADA